jgi:hypothetical protein
MPLPNMADRRAYPFDKALELRDYGAAALAATGSSTGVEFAVRKFDVAKVIIDHGAISGTLTPATNFWTVTVEISNVVGGTYTVIASTGELTATKSQIELPISGLLATYKDADAAFIRVTATKGGTIGNLTYGAYIVPA